MHFVRNPARIDGETRQQVALLALNTPDDNHHSILTFVPVKFSFSSSSLRPTSTSLLSSRPIPRSIDVTLTVQPDTRSLFTKTH